MNFDKLTLGALIFLVPGFRILPNSKQASIQAPLKVSLGGLIAMSVLLAVSALVFNVMPVLLSVIGEKRAYSDTQLGDLGASYFAGFTMVTLFAMFWVRRFNWRTIVATSLMGSALLFVILAHAQTFVGVQLSFFALGVVMAVVYTPMITCLGDTNEPDRAMGISLVLQVALAAVVAFVIPVWIASIFGLQGSMYFLAMVCVLSLLLIRTVPQCGRFQFQHLHWAAIRSAVKEASLAPKLGLLAMFMFYLGITGLWAFIDSIGKAGGLSASTMATAISIALLVGGAGPLIPALLGNWPNRFVMLVIGSLIIGVSLLLLSIPMTSISVISAIVLLNFGWNMTVAYGAANVAESDNSGLLLPMIPAAISVAAMLAPFVGGRILEHGGIGMFLGFVSIALLIANGLFLVSARMLARA